MNPNLSNKKVYMYTKYFKLSQYPHFTHYNQCHIVIRNESSQRMLQQQITKHRERQNRDITQQAHIQAWKKRSKINSSNALCSTTNATTISHAMILDVGTKNLFCDFVMSISICLCTIVYDILFIGKARQWHFIKLIASELMIVASDSFDIMIKLFVIK